MDESSADTVAEQGLNDFLDSIDWIERDDAYRATITLDSDTLTLRVAPAGVAQKAVTFLRGHFAKLLRLGAGRSDGDPAQVVEILEETLGEEGQQQLWDLIDEVFACCLHEWNVPGLQALYFPGMTLPVPNATLPVADRMEILKGLPLSVIGAVLIGSMWLAKNSLRRSKPA